MRHNNRRMKNRGGQGSGRRQGGNVPPRMQVFDSNGPDVRIRGTAWQVHEKYLALAKDAASAGDTIMAENYMQHAEHYQRIINTFTEQMGGQWTPPAQNQNGHQNANEDGMEADGNAQAQPQAEKAAPRADRRDDGGKEDGLGLPSNLFKPAQNAQALESA